MMRNRNNEKTTQHPSGPHSSRVCARETLESCKAISLVAARPMDASVFERANSRLWPPGSVVIRVPKFSTGDLRIIIQFMIQALFGLLLVYAADDRVKIDNDAVRVLNVVDQPHTPSALHRHEANRVMIYLTPGDLTVRYQDGKVEEQHWKAGQVAWSPAGGMHISENVGSAPLHIIEIELKKPASKPPARNPKLDPVKIDPKHNIL